jgi:outer membrane protein assembly factor BamB
VGTVTTTCQNCGADVPGERARFCGHCGATIEVTGSARHAAGPAGTARRKVRRTGLGAITAAGLIGAAALGSGLFGLDLDDLDVPGEVTGIGPDTPVVDPDERDAGDPGPLRCEPDGCDGWQASAPSDQLAGSAGLLYTLDDGHLSARGGSFGAEQWSVDLGDLVPVTGDGDRIAGLDDPALLRADPDGVVVVTSRAIVRHDRRGARRWRVPIDGWQVWDAIAVGGRHLVTRSRSDDGGVPFGRVAVLDLDDGAERWTRQVTQLHGLTDDLLVAGGIVGEVSAFDLADGSSRWRRSVSQQTAVRVVGQAIHLEPMFPQARPRGQLLDPTTGSTPAHLAGGVLYPPVAVGDRVITVLAGGAIEEAVRVVALDGDGSADWIHDLPASSPQQPGEAMPEVIVADVGDGSGIDVEVAGTRTSLRLADGAVVARSSGATDAEVPGPSDPGWITVGDGLAVREHPGRLQLRGPDGSVVTVRGPAPSLVATDPVVVRGGDRLLALRVGVTDRSVPR